MVFPAPEMLKNLLKHNNIFLFATSLNNVFFADTGTEPLLCACRNARQKESSITLLCFP
jgi:acetylornithine/succinyldiaminopimelate/putrescine aminotransferase